MPKFHMHLVDDNETATDPEGFFAADADEALLVGVKAAGAIMARGKRAIAFTLCLEDDQGNRLGDLPVAATCATFSSSRFTKPAF